MAALIPPIAHLSYPKRDSRRVLLVALASLVLSWLMLNRWVVTPLGFGSFGRVWHLYVNYFEFGFHRRSLEGTIVFLTGLRNALGVYEFAYVWQSLKLAILALLLYRTVQKTLPADDLLFKLFLFLSPAMLWHFAYSPGNPDLLVIIFAVLALYLDLPRVAFGAMLCVGVLLHESTMFIIPGLVVIFEYKRKSLEAPVLIVVSRALTMIVPPLLVSSVLWYTTTHNPLDQTIYEAHMAALLGPAAHKHPYWSGYFELSAPPSSFVKLTHESLKLIPQHWNLLALPTLYAVALAWAVFATLSRFGTPIAALSALAMLLPFAIFFLANDFYRWISFSCAISLVTLCHTLREERAQPYRHINLNYLFAVLLPMSLLGPFGSTPLTEPFPAARFLLHRIGMGS